jgi:hypothetical protein
MVETRRTNESLRSRRGVGDDIIYLGLRFSEWGERSLTAIAVRRGDFPKRQMVVILEIDSEKAASGQLRRGKR